MEKKNIYKSLIAFQKECPALEMNSTVKVQTKSGGSYSFNYADLGHIHSVIKPILTKNGLGFIQTFDADNNIITSIIHESGESIESSFNLSIQLVNKNAQDTGGIITYFKRYTLTAILGLSSEADDDANAAIGNKAVKNEVEEWLSDSIVEKLLKEGTSESIKKYLDFYNFKPQKDKKGVEKTRGISSKNKLKLQKKLKELQTSK